MSLCNCENRCTGISVAFVASLILGVITAFLRITAVVIETPVFLWVVLGIAVVYLFGLLLASPFISRGGSCRCLCTILGAVLLGILGAALVSVILLAVSFAATSVVGAIFLGLLLFFLSLILTSAALLVRCVVNCN